MAGAMTAVGASGSLPSFPVSPGGAPPHAESRNLAARAGRWSAHHRKKAILGWFAFVILATVLGGMVGQKTLADEDMGNGQSKTADQILEAAGFPDQTGESVLVQGKGDLKVGDQRYTAIVDDVVATLSQTEARRRGREPAREGQRGQHLRRRALHARHLRAARRRGRGQGPRRRRRSPPSRSSRRPIPRSSSPSSATRRPRRRSPRPSRRTSRRPRSAPSRSR